MDEKTKNLLRECGRELAAGWLQSAVDSATSSQQMYNQVRTLQNAAIHISATVLLNIERQENTHPDIALKILMDDIKRELEWMRDMPEGEMALSGPGGGGSDETPA